MTKIIMHKTTRTHERINVAVEFIHELNMKMRFAPESGQRSVVEERQNILYLDRKMWVEMDYPTVIAVDISPVSDLDA